MTSPALQTAQALLMTVLVIFVAGTVLHKVAGKLHIPDVVLFLAGGVTLGPAVLNWVHIRSDSPFYEMILLFGASFILLHGGIVTSMRILREVWVTITLLSTIGLLCTALIVALATHWIFGIPLSVAFLLGALLASTDPAAIVPILQKLPIERKLANTIISESAFTDATGAIVTMAAFMTAHATAHGSVWTIIAVSLRLTFAGALVGAGVGLVATFMISQHDRALLRAYPSLVLVMTALAGYLMASWLGGSGFMSVFVAGLMIGNAESFGLPMHDRESSVMHTFMETTSLKLRMLIFVLLGSQVQFGVLGAVFFPALVVVLIFMFVARPLTVLLSLVPDRKARWRGADLVFFSWVRETGVIAVALVGMLVSAHVPDGGVFVAITFMAVFMTLIVQATTTPLLASALHLTVGRSGEVQAISRDGEVTQRI